MKSFPVFGAALIDSIHAHSGAQLGWGLLADAIFMLMGTLPAIFLHICENGSEASTRGISPVVISYQYAISDATCKGISSGGNLSRKLFGNWRFFVVLFHPAVCTALIISSTFQPAYCCSGSDYVRRPSGMLRSHVFSPTFLFLSALTCRFLPLFVVVFRSDNCSVVPRRSHSLSVFG